MNFLPSLLPLPPSALDVKRMVAVDSVRASVIYFVGFVILNAFFLAQLSLAFIFNVFRGGQKGIPRMEEDIRLSRSAVAFS